MKRWRGWGERLINVMSPEIKGRGDRHALRGGVMRRLRDTWAAEELRRLAETLVPGASLISIA
jgi:hypothetical protein